MRSLYICLLSSLIACNEAKVRTATTDTISTVVTDPVDTASPIPEHWNVDSDVIKNPADTSKLIRGGKHPISLHWLGWERPGSVTIEPIDGKWYTIRGGQKTKTGHLNIEGKIRRLSDKELEFDGTIETRTEFLNNGDTCIKKGLQRFFAKGTRTYYRLQNMDNCEGNKVVDYVDIFPGKSSL